MIKNQYAKILVDGPEFMVKLAEYVNAPAIINDYKDISKFYCIRYEGPFDMVIFDGCQTAHCGRHKPHFDFGELAFPIVPYRHLPQALRGLTADCRSLV